MKVATQTNVYAPMADETEQCLTAVAFHQQQSTAAIDQGRDVQLSATQTDLHALMAASKGQQQ